MKRYHVSFYKKLVDSYGNRCRPLQGRFEIDAPNPRAAEKIAIREFEFQNGIGNWRLLADCIETERCESDRRRGRAGLLSRFFRRR
ncbi:MAG: hypothetical protein ACPW61_13895 [Methyloligella sp. ZOD6]